MRSRIRFSLDTRYDCIELCDGNRCVVPGFRLVFIFALLRTKSRFDATKRDLAGL